MIDDQEAAGKYAISSTACLSIVSLPNIIRVSWVHTCMFSNDAFDRQAVDEMAYLPAASVVPVMCLVVRDAQECFNVIFIAFHRIC